MLGKNVSIDSNPIKSCFKFFCEWGLFDGDFGTTRVRKGMPGSFPSGLLTPIVPCCNILSVHKELCVMGIELKMIDDRNLVRLRTILLGIKRNNWKGTKGDRLGWFKHNIEILVILFACVMPAWLSYCFSPNKGRMETTSFVRKGILEYQELESNPNSGGVLSKLGWL